MGAHGLPVAVAVVCRGPQDHLRAEAEGLWACVSFRQGAFSVFYCDIFEMYSTNQFPPHQHKDLGLWCEERKDVTESGQLCVGLSTPGVPEGGAPWPMGPLLQVPLEAACTKVVA